MQVYTKNKKLNSPRRGSAVQAFAKRIFIDLLHQNSNVAKNRITKSNKVRKRSVFVFVSSGLPRHGKCPASDPCASGHQYKLLAAHNIAQESSCCLLLRGPHGECNMMFFFLVNLRLHRRRPQIALSHKTYKNWRITTDLCLCHKHLNKEITKS